jgi:hypothetical protein
MKDFSASFAVLRFRRGFLAGAVGFVALWLFNGCLSKPPLVKQSFTFATPSGRAGYSSVSSRVLGIRSIEVATPYQGRLLVYRTGESSYEKDPYAEFIASPAESLGAAIRGYLRLSGLFKAVAEPGSSLKPNTVAEVYVPLLYGDFRKPPDAASVLNIRCVVFDAPSQVPSRVLFQKDYSRRIAVKARTAAAVVAAWDEALKEIMTELVADLKDKDL